MLTKNRLEAFSDGVIAILITIMVFDLKLEPLPEVYTKEMVSKVLLDLTPKLLAYTLSFLVLAIMWLNHHALFDKIPHVNIKLVWLNIFLLFSMSLIPLPTAFLASHPMMKEAVMLYGAVMWMNSFAFLLMRHYVEVTIQWIPLNRKIQRSNWITNGLYLASIPLSLGSVYLSFSIFVGIPLWYFLPEKLHQHKNEKI